MLSEDEVIKKRLAIADRYLPEVKFLIDKPNRCSLELIAGSFYWVDANGDESSLSVSHKIMSSLVSNGVLRSPPINHLWLATPVCLVAIGYDPREYLKNGYAPLPSENECWVFTGSMKLGIPMGPWNGYTMVW